MFTSLGSSSLHETPNAVMRRYPGTSIAVWRTDMAPGAAGPRHVVDTEQVLVVLEGRLHATVGDAVHTLEAGDAVTLPAQVLRQLANPHDAPAVTLTASVPGGMARVGDADPVPVPWAA